MTAVNTFGKIDWYAYYKIPIVVKGVPVKVDPFEDWPCESCSKLRAKNGCPLSLNPSSKNHCTKYNQWFRKWWPIVTGQKVIQK